MKAYISDQEADSVLFHKLQVCHRYQKLLYGSGSYSLFNINMYQADVHGHQVSATSSTPSTRRPPEW